MRRITHGMIKRLALLALAGILLMLAGCVSSDEPVDLIAENNDFNRNSIRVYVDEDVSIVFENRDDTAHNFAVYTTKDAGVEIFSGEALQGKGTITYTFTAPLEPGNYYFQCDFHPDTMNGSFDVYGTGS
ncbi:cupredoxin domain-containing protein [Chloroflexota bacterium]